MFQSSNRWYEKCLMLTEIWQVFKECAQRMNNLSETDDSLQVSCIITRGWRQDSSYAAPSWYCYFWWSDPSNNALVDNSSATDESDDRPSYVINRYGVGDVGSRNRQFCSLPQRFCRQTKETTVHFNLVYQ